MNNNPMRSLPQLDKWLQTEQMRKLVEQYPREWVVAAMQQELDMVRQEMLAKTTQVFNSDAAQEKIARLLAAKGKSSLQRVINAAGIVVHTNLGRVPMAQEAAAKAAEMAGHYNNLEYDLTSGGRGSRDSHVIRLIEELTGAEDALVVNNNAAAVLLVLDGLAKGKETVVSRGELVEIGGGFRVPEIMARTGAKLVEIGSTNKTRIDDYARAVNEETAVFMVVHRSNFRIVGFTEKPMLADVARLAEKHGIVSVYDYGGGLLDETFDFPDEDTVRQSFAAGFDVVTFSGDKLLGGPQCGIVAGKKEIIERLRKNPLLRALRVDKMIMAALEQTLLIYQRQEQREKIPVLKMLGENLDVLQARAVTLAEMLEMVCRLPGQFRAADIQVVLSDSRVGGGAMPEHSMSSYAVSLKIDGISADAFAASLRQDADMPVIVRINQDVMLMDMRTVADDELEMIARAVKNALEGFNC